MLPLPMTGTSCPAALQTLDTQASKAALAFWGPMVYNGDGVKVVSLRQRVNYGTHVACK